MGHSHSRILDISALNSRHSTAKCQIGFLEKLELNVVNSIKHKIVWVGHLLRNTAIAEKKSPQGNSISQSACIYILVYIQRRIRFGDGMIWFSLDLIFEKMGLLWFQMSQCFIRATNFFTHVRWSLYYEWRQRSWSFEINLPIRTWALVTPYLTYLSVPAYLSCGVRCPFFLDHSPLRLRCSSSSAADASFPPECRGRSSR